MEGERGKKKRKNRRGQEKSHLFPLVTWARSLYKGTLQVTFLLTEGALDFCSWRKFFTVPVDFQEWLSKYLLKFTWICVFLACIWKYNTFLPPNPPTLHIIEWGGLHGSFTCRGTGNHLGFLICIFADPTAVLKWNYPSFITSTLLYICIW